VLLARVARLLAAARQPRPELQGRDSRRPRGGLPHVPVVSDTFCDRYFGRPSEPPYAAPPMRPATAGRDARGWSSSRPGGATTRRASGRCFR